MRLDLAALLTTTPIDPQWIIRDMVPAGAIVLVAGDAGVGKTVLNVCEGLHIALGYPFLEHQTVRQRVLYFDEENSRPDISSYLQQLWIGMSQPDPAELAEWFRLEHFSLGVPQWQARMSQIVKEHRPGMIYVDTATSALAVMEENDNSEAQRLIQGLRHVMRDAGTNPSLKVLKHAKYISGGGHGGGTRRTIRGAKAWLGAVDQVMYHIVDGSGRPRKDGLRTTLLIPDKFRAYGLRVNIRITPAFTATEPKGLILKGQIFEADKDMLIVPG